MPQYRKRLGNGEHGPWYWGRNYPRDPKRNNLTLQGYYAYHARETRPESVLLCTACEELE